MDNFFTNCELTAESGTFVFALCNLGFSVGVSIAGICLIIYALVESSMQEYDMYLISRNYLWTFFFTLCAAICLLFSIILLLGVVKRNSILLKIYLIYGKSTIVVSALFAFIYALLARDGVVPMAAFFLLGLYGVVLKMIQRVCLNYSENPNDSNLSLPRYIQIIKEIYTFKANTLPEMITRLFAAINLTVAAVSFIIGIGFILFGIWRIGSDLSYRYNYSSGFTDVFYIASNSGYTVVPLFFSSISLGFAILLVNGLQERKSIQLKVYFIYGGVVETLSLFFALLYIGVTTARGDGFAVVALCLCGLYGYVLSNIYKTYQSFDTELNGTDIDEEVPNEEKPLFYEHNILLQTEILNEKNKEDGLPRNDVALVHNK